MSRTTCKTCEACEEIPKKVRITIKMIGKKYKEPKIYYMIRVCRRCGKYYKTSGKHSKVCEDCHKPSGKGRIKDNRLNE